MLGKTLSHYKILEKIGQGGMGEVYLAQDTTLDRKVALKFLPDFMQEDPTARKRFLREAKSAAALDHPFICKIYEVGEREERSFISMEYLQGETIKDKLASGTLPIQETLQKAVEIAEALEGAHRRNVVHRDLKPSNIMLTSEGHVKVMDFGLAKRLPQSDCAGSQEKAITASLTKTGATLGTLTYMSPEQLRGQEVDTRSDIFSFGVVLYEMLAAVHPFKKDSAMETASAIFNETPPPLSRYTDNVPILLQHTVRKMLAKEPNKRYQLVHDVHTNLCRLFHQAAEVSREEQLGLPRGEIPSVASGEITSIAVLPLDNLMNDPEQEYFVTGMQEALITELSKIGALRVISRTSAMRYKESDKSLPKIAQELNVDAMVEGSVLRVGQRVRITTQLIRAATDSHLWADNYDRDLSDILALHSEVAGAIAREIQVAVAPEETRRLASVPQVNPEAYEAYLKGRFHSYKLSPEHFDTALQYFQLALEKDPNCALAYEGIANVWTFRGDTGIVPPLEASPKAKAALLKAMELDETLAEVHISLANLRFLYEWDWGGAESAFRRAIQLKPNSADARFFYSDFLISMRRLEEAMAEMERALELDPFNFVFQCFFGWHLVYLHRYDEAITHLRKALGTEPNRSSAHLGLWGAFYQKRMYKEALAEAKEFFAFLGNSEVTEALARGYAEAGYPRAMSLAAEKLVASPNRTHVPAIRIARVYAHAEEKERALEWLEKAYERRESPLVHLSVFWDWDPLRDDPRFTDLLRRMNLEP